MNVLVTALDAATVVVMAVIVFVLAITPARRSATFGHLARSFVALMAAVVIAALVGRDLAAWRVTASVEPYGDALELLWTPFVLLVAYSMLALNQLDSQKAAMHGFEHASKLVDAMMSASSSGMLLLDLHGHITFANDAARQLLLLEEDPQTGSIRAPAWSLRGPWLTEAALWPLVATEPLRDLPVVVEWPNKRRRRFTVNTLPMLRGDGEVYGVLASFERAPWLEAGGHVMAENAG